MDFDGLKNFEYFISLGSVIMIASILTIIIMQIYKIILRRRKKLTDDMDPNKKDAILSISGRYIALILYVMLYISNEIYLHHDIIFDGALLTGLLSGSALTLTLAKGIYTSIRQYQKKKTVFEKLESAEEQLNKLKEEFILTANRQIEDVRSKEEKEKIFIIGGKMNE